MTVTDDHGLHDGWDDPDAPPHTDDDAPYYLTWDTPPPPMPQRNGNRHKSTSGDDADKTSSWQQKDLRGIRDRPAPPPPDYATRTDGRALFYKGRLNSMFGESGEGKTYIILAAVAEVLNGGGVVLFVDFETEEGTVAHKLSDLGVPWATIEDPERFIYLDPAEPVADGKGKATRGGIHFHELLADHQPDLVVADGVTDGMGIHGLDPLGQADVSRFRRLILDPLVATGAAVITIDHVTKDRESRKGSPIGAQHKTAIITGAAYEITAVNPFARGHDGLLKVVCRKDKGGGHWRKGQTVAEAHVTTSATAVVGIELRPPANETDPDAPFRPTVLMERVSRWLADNPGQHSHAAVRAQVKGKDSGIISALEILTDEGYIREQMTLDSGARMVEHARPFREQGSDDEV